MSKPFLAPAAPPAPAVVAVVTDGHNHYGFPCPHGLPRGVYFANLLTAVRAYYGLHESRSLLLVTTLPARPGLGHFVREVA